jgi:hypothetical protein
LPWAHRRGYSSMIATERIAVGKLPGCSGRMSASRKEISLFDEPW